MADQQPNQASPAGGITPEERRQIAAQRLLSQGVNLQRRDSKVPEGVTLVPLDETNPHHLDPDEGGPAPVQPSLDDPNLAYTPEHPLSLGPPEYEKMLMDVEDALRASGEFDGATINNVLRPGALIDQKLDYRTLNRMYEIAEPVMAENEAALAAARDLFMQMEDQGIEREGIDWSVLRSFASKYTDDALIGLEGFARWRRRVARKAGETAALLRPQVLGGYHNALSLMDLVARGVNKFRIESLHMSGQMSEQEEIALKKAFLPPVQLVNPRTGEEDFYGTQAGALWDKTWDQTAATWRMTYHQGLSWFNTLIGKDEKATLHQRFMEDAKTDALDAAAMIPQIPQQFAPPMYALEALEGVAEPETVAKVMTDPYLTAFGMGMSEEQRLALIERVKEEGDVWPVWDELNNSKDKLMTLVELTAYNTASDILWDPILLTAGAGGKGFEATRKLLGAVAPGAKARTLAKVAANTAEHSDAIASVRAAEAHVAKLEAKAIKAAEGNAGLVPGEALTELNNARQALLNEQHNLANFTRRATGDEMDMFRRAGRKNPDFIPETTRKVKVEKEIEGVVETVEEVQAKSVQELGDELDAFRRREAVRERDWALEKITEETRAHPTTQQRLLFGPDDMEQGGDTLNHLVRTGGKGVDDVALTPAAAEYSWDPARVTSQLEWNMVDDVVKTEAEIGIRRGSFQYDLGASAQRTLAREEDRVRRALGAARRMGLKEDVALLTDELRAARRARGAVGKLSKEERAAVKAGKWFDERWAGDQPTSLRKAGKLEQWINDAPDRMMRGLYPDSFHLTSNSKLFGTPFSLLRDPLRFLRTYHPKLGEQMRLAYRRFDHHTLATQEIFEGVFERAGIIERHARVKQAGKDFAPFRVNKERSEQLWDLLDTRKTDEKFQELWDKADDSLRKAHDEIRTVLDDFADQQGLTGTSRYLQGYMRHVVTEEQFAKNARPLEFIGLSGKAEVFVSHLLKRRGGNREWVKDLPMVLDLYNRAARRKQFLEPLYFDLQTGAKELAMQHRNTRMGNYLKATIDVLQGKSSFLGKMIDAVNGRPIDAAGRQVFTPNKLERALTGITTALWTTSIPFNPRYGLMQMTAGLSTTASRLGALRTQRGMMAMMTQEGQHVARKLGFYDTVTQMMESNWLKGMADALGDLTGINRIEAYIRGVTAHAAMDMRMTEMGIDTWRQAVGRGAHNRILFDSMRMAENVNHMFGPLSRSPYINRFVGQPAGSALTQFNLYSVKQTEELISLANKNPGFLVDYFAISGWMQRLFAQHVGYDVSQWTGIGYSEEILTGNVESPFSDMMKKWQDIGAAATRGDTGAVEAAVKAAMVAAQSLTPVLIRDATKAAERLRQGHSVNSREEYVRRLFLGENENLLRRVAEGLDPGLDPTRKDPAPGLGGDLIPTVTGGPPIRDRLQRIATKGMREQKARDITSMRGLVNDLMDGLRDGENQKVRESLRLLSERHGLRISDDSLKNRAGAMMFARYLSQNLRFLQDNPQYVDLFLRLLQNNGAGTGME